jgi:tRNA dimethylallyltransferase
VDAIHAQGNWPILVGGTHYYIQSLLFQNSILKTPKPKEKLADHPILSAPTGDLFAFLQKVDPVQAAKLHPSDKRKIQAKVELYLRTGYPASQLYKEQKENGIDIRWDTLIFWVWSERDALNKRLDRRVDNMIKMGVEDECRRLYRVAEQSAIPVSSGVFQAIGMMFQVVG